MIDFHRTEPAEIGFFVRIRDRVSVIPGLLLAMAAREVCRPVLSLVLAPHNLGLRPKRFGNTFQSDLGQKQ